MCDHTPNETEISHGRGQWQARRSCFAKGPLASSIGYVPDASSQSLYQFKEVALRILKVGPVLPRLWSSLNLRDGLNPAIDKLRSRRMNVIDFEGEGHPATVVLWKWGLCDQLEKLPIEVEPHEVFACLQLL